MSEENKGGGLFANPEDIAKIPESKPEFKEPINFTEELQRLEKLDKPAAKDEEPKPKKKDTLTIIDDPVKEPEPKDCDMVNGVLEFNPPVKFNGPIKVTGSITLASKDDRSSISLQTNEHIAGIWIQSASLQDKFPKSSIALYDDDNGPVIGFYRDTGEKDLALTFAIGVDENGDPVLQVHNGRGNTGLLRLGELLDKVSPGWR